MSPDLILQNVYTWLENNREFCAVLIAAGTVITLVSVAGEIGSLGLGTPVMAFTGLVRVTMVYAAFTIDNRSSTSPFGS